MKLTLDGRCLKIEMEGAQKFWSLKFKEFNIPLENIMEAYPDRPKYKVMIEPRVGTYVPFKFRAGRYFTVRGKEFWYYDHGKNPLTIELKDENYKRIILGTDDSHYWAGKINTAVRKKFYYNKRQKRNKQ